MKIINLIRSSRLSDTIEAACNLLQKTEVVYISPFYKTDMLEPSEWVETMEEYVSSYQGCKYRFIMYPETVLHIDEQVDLIDNLIPFCHPEVEMLIFYTESPAIVQKGWRSTAIRVDLNKQQTWN